MKRHRVAATAVPNARWQRQISVASSTPPKRWEMFTFES